MSKFSEITKNLFRKILNYDEFHAQSQTIYFYLFIYLFYLFSLVQDPVQYRTKGDFQESCCRYKSRKRHMGKILKIQFLIAVSRYVAMVLNILRIEFLR